MVNKNHLIFNLGSCDSTATFTFYRLNQWRAKTHCKRREKNKKVKFKVERRYNPYTILIHTLNNNNNNPVRFISITFQYRNTTTSLKKL